MEACKTSILVWWGGQVMLDCKAVVGALRGQHGASALGAQGFCWGGLYTALLLAGAGARRLGPSSDPTRPPTPAACPLLYLLFVRRGPRGDRSCQHTSRGPAAPLPVEQERALCRMQCLCGGARPLAWAGGCVHLARPGRPGGAGCTRAGRATVSTCAVPDRERPARRINRSTWSDSPTAANTAAPAAAAGPAPLCVWCLKARAESGAAARGQAAAASMQASSPTARASRRRT
jgi:hypothetical protein